MMKIDNELLTFILKNIPSALHMSPKWEYSDEDYKGARKVLKDDLRHFKEEDREFVTQSFACLIKSIMAYKQQLEDLNENSLQENGEAWKQYYEMIPELNRVLECFHYSVNTDSGTSGKIFPIKKIVFEGGDKIQKGGKYEIEKIVLEGTIIGFVGKMFAALDRVYSKQDLERLREFSDELYNAYITYMTEFRILTSEDGTLGTRLTKVRKMTDKQRAITSYKHYIASNVHYSLNKLVQKKSPAKYPAINTRIIGKLLEEVSLDTYVPPFDNKKIANFISRGNAKKSTRTRKQGK